jgi:hypothetical protein
MAQAILSTSGLTLSMWGRVGTKIERYQRLDFGRKSKIKLFDLRALTSQG